MARGSARLPPGPALYRKAATRIPRTNEQEVGTFYQCGFVGHSRRVRPSAIALVRPRKPRPWQLQAAKKISSDYWPRRLGPAKGFYAERRLHGITKPAEKRGNRRRPGKHRVTCSSPATACKRYRHSDCPGFQSGGRGNRTRENNSRRDVSFGRDAARFSAKAPLVSSLGRSGNPENGLNNLRAITSILKLTE